MGLRNAAYLKPSAKLLFFETEIPAFVGIWEKLLLFEIEIATFVGIYLKIATFLLKVLHFLGNLDLLLLVEIR